MRRLSKPTRTEWIVFGVFGAAAITTAVLVLRARHKTKRIPASKLGFAGQVAPQSHPVPPPSEEGDEHGTASIGPQGDVVHLELSELEPDDRGRIAVEVVARVELASDNMLYGQPGETWCRAVVIHAELAAGEYNATIDNMWSEPISGCDDDKPFPADFRPKLSLDHDGNIVRLKVDAPAIAWGDAYWEPGTGKTPDWVDKHIRAKAYYLHIDVHWTWTPT